jgi:hypothetical protein
MKFLCISTYGTHYVSLEQKFNYFFLFSYAEELSPPGRARSGTEGGRRRHHQVLLSVLRIRIRDPVPFLPLDPGSGTGFFRSRIPDPGAQTHIFKSLVTTFWVKSSIIL